MDGIIDRILNGDGPRPLDIDTAAAMLSTTPGLLREFERSYHANVLDRKNAPTGPLGPDAKTVVESRSGHGLSDEALALDARIVRELLSDTGVIRFDGERLTTIPALAPVPESYVTEADVNALQTGERPQLAGELIHRQIDAVNYPLLLICGGAPRIRNVPRGNGMAPAERSTYYEQAVPKGKRRPMMENWMPELGGEH